MVTIGHLSGYYQLENLLCSWVPAYLLFFVSITAHPKDLCWITFYFTVLVFLHLDPHKCKDVKIP